MRYVGFVYQITLFMNGHRYIGMTSRTVQRRIREHLNDKRRYFYRRKFKVRTLRRFRYNDKLKLFKLERYYINKLKPELNAI